MRFEAGNYEFHGEWAASRFDLISNHDAGIKQIIFDLTHRTDWHLAAEGAKFWFHDEVIPIRAEASKDLTLSGFSIDWRRPLIVEPEIVAVDEDSVLLEMPDAIPYLVSDRRLFFRTGEEYFPLIRMMELDVQRRVPAYASGDNFAFHAAAAQGWNFNWAFCAEGSRRVRARGRMGTRPVTGNRVYCKFGPRVNPGIQLRECENVRIEDLTLHYAGAMGILAERCRNVSLESVVVAPPPGGTRLTSARADATHFVSCSGLLSLRDCRFEGQHDDGVNVHGIYGRILRRESGSTIWVERAHFQQLGQPLGLPGDRFRFVDGATLQPLGEAVLQGVTEWNHRCSVLRFDRSIDCWAQAGNGVENLARHPRLDVLHCCFRGNRARGLLIGTSGGTLVESCEFSVPGSAVRIAPDCRNWFESGKVDNVTIRKNRFLNNNYATPGWPHWGLAAIDIVPEIDPARMNLAPVVGSVRIEDNAFETFGPPVINAVSVAHLSIRRNTIISSTDYPSGAIGDALIHLANCPAAVLEEIENRTDQRLVSYGEPKFAPVQVNKGYGTELHSDGYG